MCVGKKYRCYTLIGYPCLEMCIDVDMYVYLFCIYVCVCVAVSVVKGYRWLIDILHGMSIYLYKYKYVYMPAVLLNPLLFLPFFFPPEERTSGGLLREQIY